jgi:hypothetical protein
MGSVWKSGRFGSTARYRDDDKGITSLASAIFDTDIKVAIRNGLKMVTKKPGASDVGQLDKRKTGQ